MHRWIAFVLAASGALPLTGCTEDATTTMLDASSASDDASASTDAAQTQDASSNGTDAGPDGSPADDGSTPADAGTDAMVVVPLAPSAAGDIVITEIQAAPVGYANDNLAEWIEIYNPSASTTYNLKGCVFADKPADDDYTITVDFLVPPGAYRVLSSAMFTTQLHGFESDEVYGPTGTGLSGTADAPTIKCGGAIIDTVSYAASGGYPGPDANQGHTLQLDRDALSAVSNDTGTNWCYSTTLFFTSNMMDNFGSPRAENADCP